MLVVALALFIASYVAYAPYTMKYWFRQRGDQPAMFEVAWKTLAVACLVSVVAFSVVALFSTRFLLAGSSVILGIVLLAVPLLIAKTLASGDEEAMTQFFVTLARVNAAGKTNSDVAGLADWTYSLPPNEFRHLWWTIARANDRGESFADELLVRIFERGRDDKIVHLTDEEKRDLASVPRGGRVTRASS